MNSEFWEKKQSELGEQKCNLKKHFLNTFCNAKIKTSHWWREQKNVPRHWRVLHAQEHSLSSIKRFIYCETNLHERIHVQSWEHASSSVVVIALLFFSSVLSQEGVRVSGEEEEGEDEGRMGARRGGVRERAFSVPLPFINTLQTFTQNLILFICILF